MPSQNILRITLISLILLTFFRLHSFAQEPPFHQTMELGKGTINDIAWSSDGQTILVGGSQGIWAYTDAFVLTSHISREPINSLAWSPDGQYFASEDETGVMLWDATTFQQIVTLPESAKLGAWNPSGTQLVVASSSADLMIWDMNTQDYILTYSEHRTELETSQRQFTSPSISWSNDGDYIASATYQSGFIWNASTGHTETLFGEEILQVAWGPVNSELAIIRQQRTLTDLEIWEFENLQFTLIDSISLPNPWGNDLAWSPDGTQIAVLDAAQQVSMYDVNTMVQTSQYEAYLRPSPGGHESQLNIIWHPIRNIILTSTIGSARLWNPYTGQIIATLEGHMAWVQSFAWSPNGSQIASGHGDGATLQGGDTRLRIWNTSSGDIVNTCEGHKGQIRGIAWRPNGTQIAASAGISNYGEIILWNPTTCGWTWLGDYSRIVKVLGWTLDGQYIIAYEWDVMLLDPTIEQTTDIPRYAVVQTYSSGDLTAILLNSDSARLALVNHNTITLQEISDDAVSTIGVIDVDFPSEEQITAMAWSPNGSILATGSGIFNRGVDDTLDTDQNDNTVRLWGTTTGDLLATLVGHNRAVTVLAWSPDGTQLASGSNDHTIIIWESESRNLIQRIETHTDTITAVVWSPDGAMLATGSVDGTIQVWSDK